VVAAVHLPAILLGAAYAAFSKLEVYTNIIGRDLTAIRPWLFNWGELGLIQICGKNAANLDAVIGRLQGDRGTSWRPSVPDFVINTDVIVLSTPEIAGLPYVISGWSRPADSPPRSPRRRLCSPSPTRSVTTSTTR